MKPKQRTLTEIVWLDTASHSIRGIMEYPCKDLEQFLVETHSYGLVVRENRNVVILQYFKNDVGDREFIAIPKGVIKERKEYKIGHT